MLQELIYFQATHVELITNSDENKNNLKFANEVFDQMVYVPQAIREEVN